MMTFPATATLTLADSADAYGREGFAIFPVKARGKAPLTCGQCGLSSWTRDATTDRDAIARWWQHHPTANVGCVPGLSGYVVVDVDNEAEGKALRDLLGANIISATMRTVTAHGAHVWFSDPDAATFGTGRLRTEPPVLWRGRAGYVVVPPSIHATGAVYVFDGMDAMAAPSTLRDQLREAGEGATRVSSKDVERWVERWNQSGTEPAAQATIQDITDKLNAASPGMRHDIIAAGMRRLAGEVTEGVEYDLPAAMATLQAAWEGVLGPKERSRRSELRKALAWAISAAGQHAEKWLAFEADPLTVAIIGHSTATPSAQVLTLAGPNIPVVSPERVDLGDILAGGLAPATTTMFARTDGEHLLYPGKSHSLVGAPESGKTWVALVAIMQQLVASTNPGVVAVMVDYEDSARTYLRRLVQDLGVPAKDATERTAYYSPQGALELPRVMSMQADLATAEIVVIDSVNEAMVASGLDPLSNKDAVTFRQNAINPIIQRAPQAALVFVDHEGHAGGGRALGATMKRAGITGVEYVVRATEQPRPGAKGVVSLYVVKDREGQVRKYAAPLRQNQPGQHVANLTMEPTAATGGFGQGGSIKVTLWPPAGLTPAGAKVDDQLAAAIHDVVADRHQGGFTPISKATIVDGVRGRGVARRDADVRAEVDRLADDGALSRVKGYQGHEGFEPGPMSPGTSGPTP